MDNMSVDFRLTIPLQKSERTDGWYITGIAAGTEPDLEGDVLTDNCIKSFADQINTQPVPFRNWHNVNSITSDMGTVEKAWIENGSQLGVEVRLDEDNPDAQYLWKKLAQGKQYGMSVEGGIQKYEYDTARKSSIGRQGRNIDGVVLREISATTRPVYTPSFGTVLRKAIDEAEEAKSVAQGDTSAMDPLVQTGESVEAQTPAQAAAAPASAPEAETPAVEKAVNADTARDAKKLAKVFTLARELNTLVAELTPDAQVETQPAVSDTPAEVAKSESGTTSELETLVKSFNETTAALRAEIESLKERIPAVPVPGVLTKSEQEEQAEAVETLRQNPQLALRAALAASRGEVFNR
jgi:HAMP domain-containing protein